MKELLKINENKEHIEGLIKTKTAPGGARDREGWEVASEDG